MKQISTSFVKRFLTQTLAMGALFAVSVYLWVRVLLHDVPFNIAEEIEILLQMILTSWGIIAGFKGSFHSMSFIVSNKNEIMLKLKPLKYQLAPLTVLLAVIVMMAGCTAYAQGIKKDLKTGMISQYSGLTVEDSKIIMNDEVLGHTDIPIGESFIILNEGVNGLTVKDNKVSVGCSLVIADKNGKVLLSVPDLFKGNDTFDKNRIDYLKCTVNTGEPMEWEEKYSVKTVFTDKYGKGTIENMVTIRMIDIP